MIRLKKFCKMKLMIRVQKVEEKILPLQKKKSIIIQRHHQKKNIPRKIFKKNSKVLSLKEFIIMQTIPLILEVS